MTKAELRAFADRCAHLTPTRCATGKRGATEGYMRLITEGSDRDLQDARIEMELRERERRKR